MAATGRPTKWTAERYYRLWEFVSYYQGELRQTVRRSCQYLAEREPWRGEGVSAETLRRRYREAARLHAAGKLGQDQPLNFNFALTQDDMRAMMGPMRYRRAMEEWSGG